MKVLIKPSHESIGLEVADSIEKLVRENPAAVLGVATGSSPLPVYAELVRRHREEGLSFARCQAFMLDEYVGIAADHPERYRNFIDRFFASQVDFAEGAVHGPDGLAEIPEVEAMGYDDAIEKAGGVDFQILGVGSNGHIAFNEPGSTQDTRTRTIALTEQTRTDNARFFDGDVSQVPRLALTQGLGTIMQSREIVMIAIGEGKAEAVRELVEGQARREWPVTILQRHPNTTVYLDEASASLLSDPALHRQA